MAIEPRGAKLKEGEPPKSSTIPQAPRLTAEELQSIRQAVRDEIENMPMSSLSKFLVGLTVTGFAIAIYSLIRITSKARSDFSSRSADREWLLFGREASIVEEPKVLVVTKHPAPNPGEDPIIEVDDPRLETLDFRLEELGPYTTELLKGAAKFCTHSDPLILEHINEVAIPRLSWAFDALAERNLKHFFAALRTSRELIAERANEKLRRELKFTFERGFSDGAVDAVGGKFRKRQQLLVTTLCNVRPDNTRSIMFIGVSAAHFEKFLSTAEVGRMISDNPEKARELEMIATACAKEAASRHNIKKDSVSSVTETHRPGHSRHGQQPKSWRILIPVAGWLKPPTNGQHD